MGTQIYNLYPGISTDGSMVELPVSGPYGGLKDAGGIMLPFSGISLPNELNVNIATPNMTLPMSSVRTSEAVSLQANDSEITGDLGDEGNLADAFGAVSTSLTFIPEFIVTTATVPEFSWVGQNVIIFIGDEIVLPWISISYPDTLTPVFDNSWLYTWYFRRECYPPIYYCRKTAVAKIGC